MIDFGMGPLMNQKVYLILDGVYINPCIAENSLSHLRPCLRPSSINLWEKRHYVVTRIMHQNYQLADLVDVLAVDLDIVDRLGDSRKRHRQNDRKTIEPLQGLTDG